MVGCVSTKLNVIIRCDVKGIITCRGPNDNKKYWKKCKNIDSPKCAMSLISNKMREERINILEKFLKGLTNLQKRIKTNNKS